MSTRFAIDVDPALVAAARAGNRAAQERIYRLFERPGYTLALRLLADPDDAREVWHDAMVSVFGALTRYRGECPFWAWLRRIVVNTALMRQRGRRLRAAHAGSWADGLGSDQACDRPGPMRIAESAQLEQALAGLPASTRCVIWLYCVEGYQHPEIATLMGQSVSFSKSQLSRGLARLRQELRLAEEVYDHAGCR